MEVTPDFPEKLPKKFEKIIKRFAPFEDLALAAGEDPVAGLDLNDLMETEGALNDELVREITSAAKMLRAFLKAQEVKIIKTDSVVEGDMERHTTNAESVKRFERFHLRVGANFTQIIKRLEADRRPVAQRFIAEIAHTSLLMSMAEHMQINGIERAMQEQQQHMKNMREDQRMIFDAVMVAALYDVRGGIPEDPTRTKDAFELLRDGAYAPTTEQGVEIDMPGVVFDGKHKVRAVIRTHEAQNPLVIGVIEIYNPTVDKVLARFSLSRINGELVPDGMHVMSAESVFASLQKQELYNRIRDIAFTEFLAAVERNEIHEQPFVSFVGEEQKEVKTFRTPKIRIATPPHAPTMPAAVPEQVTPEIAAEAPVIPTTKTKTPSPVQQTSIEAQIAALNRPREASEEKESRVVWLERRITWRRALSALKRLGVSIDLSGAHPKLKYGAKVTRYLNAHDNDTEHNKHELYRVLRELSISRDAFFAQLK